MKTQTAYCAVREDNPGAGEWFDTVSMGVDKGLCEARSIMINEQICNDNWMQAHSRLLRIARVEIKELEDI